MIFLGDIYEWTDSRLLALQNDAVKAVYMHIHAYTRKCTHIHTYTHIYTQTQVLLALADPAINVVVSLCAKR